MSSSNGTIVRNSFAIRNGIYNKQTGQPMAGSEYTQTVQSTESWTWPSPRVRPNPLGVTTGSTQRNEYNPASAEVRYNDVYVKRGSLQYCDPNLKFTVKSSRQLAYRMALKAINGASQGEFNAATFFGEGRETAHMIAKRARQVAEAAKALKHGNMSALADVLAIPSISRRASARVRDTPIDKRLANHWLEYTYGWKPLVQDVHGALEHLHRGMTGEGKLIRKTKSSRSTGSTWDPLGNSYEPGAKASFSGTVSNSSARTLQELGLLNPASLAWELLPYSFVVDWFLPIADIFGALTADIGLKDVTRCVVWEESTVASNKLGVWSSSKLIYREPLFSNVVPVLSFLPDLNQSWQHIISGVSLIRQRFR